MAAVFSKATKRMLTNVIRHTNSHNKTVEEGEMWQQHERMKELGGLDPSNPSYGHDDRCAMRNDRDRRRNDYWNSRSEKRAHLSTSHRSRRAHMDEEEEKGRAGISTSTYWMRQLDKLESSDPNRWDHGGYRELYPQDFRSDRSDSDSSRQRSHRHREDRKSRTKKKKKHRSRSKKQRQKEKKTTAHRHRKQAKRRKPSTPSDEDSDSESYTSESSFSAQQVRQHIPRQRRDEKRQSHRYSSRERSSGSYSDSNSRERFPSRKQKPTKRSHDASVPKLRRYDKTKTSRYASSGSSGDSYSDSDSDSDGRGRFHSVPKRPRKGTRDSPVLVSSTDRSGSVSSPHRKKARTLNTKRKDRSKAKKKAKHKRKNGGHPSQGGLGDRDAQENQRVVEMWKRANGHVSAAASSKNGDFDPRLQKEISSQYRGLKQAHYAPKHGDKKTDVNGSSSKKRRRYSSSSSSSSSSDSD